MHLNAILAGSAQPIASKSGKTGFFKRPLEGPQRITSTGLSGDAIVDTDNHGGRDQAIYLMGSVDYDHWRTALGRPLFAGAFGENLVVDGWSSASAAVGDRFRFGGCEIELTAPRIPCVTLAEVMKDRLFPKRFFAEGHPGAYARVLTSGSTQVGDTVVVTPFNDGPRITMATLLSATANKFNDPALLADLARVPAHHLLTRMAHEAVNRT